MKQDNLTQTLVKGLRVLECIALSETYLSAIQVAEKCDLSRSTAYRLLVTLEEMNYVLRVNESNFRIGPEIFVLGKKELERDDLPTLAKSFLIKLNEKTGETVILTTLLGADVISIARIESANSVRIGSRVGSIYPAYCTAMGKAILAFLDKDKQDVLISQMDFFPRTENTIIDRDEFNQHLDQVLQQGYAVDNEESEENIKCIFAPVFNTKGEVIASIGFSGIAYRVNKLNQKEMIDFVVEAASDLSKMIGFIPQQLSTIHNIKSNAAKR